MNITYVNDSYREINYMEKPDEGMSDEPELQADQVATVAEIFNTPLTGSYNWDYVEHENRIKKLYELGKSLSWDATKDIEWQRSLDWHQLPKRTKPVSEHPLNNYPPYANLSDEDKALFQWHSQSWIYSQFLHGEQGALLVASQLVSCAPTFNAKLYAASQTFDEARHVEVFNRYIQRKLGFIYPISAPLKSILDRVLTDKRWDLKFIGMQIIIEGLALGAFNTIKATTMDPVLRQILELVVRDEARHAAFGIHYLIDHIKTLSAEEVEERAQFAYEACVLSRERLMQFEVWQHWGFDVQVCREISLSDGLLVGFQKSLFSRIIPNLRRVGLLTDSVKEKFDKIGFLTYADMPDDGDFNWAELSKPLAPARKPALA
jgi:hypothetical protein